MEVACKRSLRLVLVAMLLVVCLSSGVRANGRLVVTAAPGSPDADRPDQPAEDLEIAYERVEVEIQNQAVVTRVSQQFRNHTGRVLEGEYLHRLPPEASLSAFAIWDGNDRVPGVIRRKEDAREVYDHIVRQQRDPGLLEQVSDTLFRAKVFPIPPRSDKKIELEYREMLPVESGVAMYRFPLVADRGGARQIRELAITVGIRDGSEIAAAWSPMPGTAIHHQDARHVMASFEASRWTPDRDFHLFYKTLRPASGMRLLAHRTGSTPGYVMLSISPPDEGIPARAKEVVFVVDTSLSMEGLKLRQAQKALGLCLGALEPRDRFAMVRFSSDVERYGDGLQPCDEDRRVRARQWVDRLAASSATDIQGAMLAALRTFPARPCDPGVSRYVVFLTDGEPTAGETDPDAIVKAVLAANAAGVRIFTFGIDEAADSRLLASISRGNRGESISVGAGDDLDTRLPIFFGKLTRPLFENVLVDWGGLAVTQAHPREVPHFYLGRQVTVVGRYTTPGKGRVRLTATVEGKPVAYEQDATLPESEPDGAFVERLWAQREVGYLLSQAPEERLADEIREEIVRLSMAHAFVTPFTSFIAVPEKEKQALPADLRQKLEPVERGAKVQAGSPRKHAGPRSPAPDTGPFSEVPRGHWTYEAIQKAAESGILQGWDNKFHGQKIVNRYQMAVAVARMTDRQSVLEKNGKVTTASEKARLAALQAAFAPELAQLNARVDRAANGNGLPAEVSRPLSSVSSSVLDIDRALDLSSRSSSASTGTSSCGGEDGMDVRWRTLRNQVLSTRAEVRLLRAHLQNLELRAGGQPAARLRPVIERVEVRPQLVRGGEPAEISLTVAFPAGARPKISWAAREGQILESREAAAVWLSPPVPGAYTVQVTLTTPSGETYTEDVDLEVFQPGKITYSPAHLDERLWILGHALQQLKTEQSAVHDALARLGQLAVKSGPQGLDELDVEAPSLVVSPRPGVPDGASLRADPVGATHPVLCATGGRVERTGAAGTWAWTGAAGQEWQIVTAQWSPNQRLHWLVSVPRCFARR